MSSPAPCPKLTEAEYLQLERAADFKSEFFAGEIFAMAGGNPQHSLIGTNFCAEVSNLLRSSPCAAYNADLRIKIAATGLITYPDLSVICGPLEFAAGTDDTIVNPTLIGEVLSTTTEAYDRGKKFELYRRIPTLAEYLLVGQHEPIVEQFIRQPDGTWLMKETVGLDAKLELPSLRITLSLAEVFAKVQFVPAPMRVVTPFRR